MLKLIVYCITAACFFASCAYTTYTPHTKKQQLAAQPSMVLLERIAEFREKFNSWPLSKEDFISKDSRYRDAFAGFKYQSIRFKTIDADNMVFYFSQHVQDVAIQKESEKVDLNAFGGEVKFFKENGRIVWKLKMY